MMKQKVQTFFKEHHMAFIIALLVGVSIVFPQFLFIYQAGEQYQGFNIFETDSEYYFMARIRDVYDGHYKLSSPLLAGGKDLPYVQPPLPELIMGLTGKILHLDISSVLILYRFFLPFLLFLLIYFLVLAVTNGDKKSAILSSAIIIIASNLVSYPQQLLEMFKGNFFASQFADYARPVNPQISSFFFFGFLYLFWRLIHSPLRRYVYYCIALFGLSFYVYIYTWTFLTLFIGLQIVILFWQKRFDLMRKIILVLVSGYIIAIPYFINTYNVINHFSYQTLVFIYGLYNSHQFIFSSIFFISFLLLTALYFFQKIKDKDFFWFFMALIVSGFIAINQQILTGRIMQYGHYHWYFNKPILIVIFSVFIFTILRKLQLKEVYKNLFLLIIIFLAFFNIYNIQYTSYQHHFNNYLQIQKYRSVIQWFNEHAQKDEVVYVPESFYYPIDGRSDIGSMPSRMLGRFIVSYTPLNLYFFTSANLSLLPYQDYNKYNLLLVLKLLDVKPENTFVYLRRHPDIFGDVYLMYFKVRGLNYKDIPDEWVEDIVEQYKEFYKMSWKEIFSQYPLDYIVWDKIDLPDLPFDDIKDKYHLYKEVYNKQEIVVYKL